MAVNGNRKLKPREFCGTTDAGEREYEIRHRLLAREAAADGMVLLRNRGQTLPISDNSKVALYGFGALHTYKGGTGSGDVNQRDYVNVYEGLKNAGVTITNQDWLDAYEEAYQKERLSWRDRLLHMTHEENYSDLPDVYYRNPMPVVPYIDPVATDADVALFVLSRNAGEGADRHKDKGDYLLTDDEYSFIGRICSLYDKVVLIVNSGGMVDLSFTDDFDRIASILYISQPGMEAGNAVADILTGKVTPSGKLTDTWAYSYEDYPGAEEYSYLGSTLEYATYREGIYVGYRYFDSFDKPVRYGFGYGLSYTGFDTKVQSVSVRDLGQQSQKIIVEVSVENTGDTYSGREVVQVYVSCPDGRIAKEHRRLVGFAKTDNLAPGQAEQLKIEFSPDLCTSFDEEIPGYILEEGYYGIWVGNSLGDSDISGLLYMDHSVVVTGTDHICPLEQDMTEIEGPTQTGYAEWVDKAKQCNLPVVDLSEAYPKTRIVEYGVNDYTDPEALEMAKSLETEELIELTTGDLEKGDLHTNGWIGSSGISVPGSAAETSMACEKRGIDPIVLSDGPAGLRLDQVYYVDPDEKIIQQVFIERIEDGLFLEEESDRIANCRKYYQFCTAFPVGTLLAQTWDTDVVFRFGRAVAEEMEEFRTTLWLAPGMNIHRNPLCGRNFEYYSEDPFLTGMIAAAVTKGVQSVSGCGTTIKHFACNNQEENRMGCDSRVSERALREIYLKGFEICVRSAQPMALMTSYNLVNGVHTANSYDLCTKVLRDEWGFEGLVMTDWTTTEKGPDCTASGCMRAGNDLICPGNASDHANLREELNDGTLSLDEIHKCVSRVIHTVWQSNIYEGAVPYGSQSVQKRMEYLTVKKEPLPITKNRE